MIPSVSRYLSVAELLLWHRGGGGEGAIYGMWDRRGELGRCDNVNIFFQLPPMAVGTKSENISFLSSLVRM